MVKTYILAPNWTTAPPPEGPLKLGHLLDDLTDFVPVNRRGTVEISPEYLNKVDVKDGFQSSRSSLVSGELGFFAKVIGILGVGAGSSVYYNKDANDVLSCTTMETITFDPTADYIAESMRLSEVAMYMKGCQFKQPLYMITGFKVGRGGSLQSKDSRSKGLRFSIGMNPPGIPVGFENSSHLIREITEEESWEASTDFIVAFRVRKIWYHREKINDKPHNKKAVMQDGSHPQHESPTELLSSDEIKVEDLSETANVTRINSKEDGEDVEWIIPMV